MNSADVVQMLCARGYTIGLAESCTGGMLAAAITSIPGSSACFELGVVSYSNQAKNHLLAVSQAVLDEFGAVSEETAAAMARGIRQLAQSDIGLSITGIAGPGGGSPEKPVGLVYIAITWNNFMICTENQFSGSREMIRQSTVNKALAMILALEKDLPRSNEKS